MRLEMLEKGRSLRQKLGFAAMRWLMGQVPGPVLALSHRPHFFGGPLNACFQEALRGPSDFSIGERELFAAFVSRLNECSY
jgi:hypothetical protein